MFFSKLRLPLSRQSHCYPFPKWYYVASNDALVDSWAVDKIDCLYCYRRTMAINVMASRLINAFVQSTVADGPN